LGAWFNTFTLRFICGIIPLDKRSNASQAQSHLEERAVARTANDIPEEKNTLYLLSLGYLCMVYPRSMIDEVLQSLNKGSERIRLLPAELVVYFIIAMCFWREPRQDKILKIITETVNYIIQGKAVTVYPSCAAISKAKTKLGSDVLHKLADLALQPLAPIGLPGAWYKGKRLVAWDGTTFAVPDDTENAEFFGYPAASRGDPAFPHARVEALIETGTRAILAAEIGPYKMSEISLCNIILDRGKLLNDTLLLADRNYFWYRLWSKATETQAWLLWRVKKNLNLCVDMDLPDGSYLSKVYDSKDRTAPALQVRVIEYKLKGNNTEIFCLITNIFDYIEAPASELASLYHERWEVELLLTEIKTVLCAHSSKYATPIRSRRPDLVLQEIWGLVLAHYAIKNLIVQAAIKKKYDPDDISFSDALEIVRRKMPHSAVSPP
jgi:hypothetical protein